MSLIILELWRVKSGEWKVKSGEWKVESGAWRVESGAWSVERGEWREHLTDSDLVGTEALDPF